MQLVEDAMYRTIACAAALLLALCPVGGAAAADDAATCKNAQGDDKIAACSRVLGRNPNDVDAYDYRGMGYWQKGEYDSAVADFDEAIRLNPTGVQGAAHYIFRGLAYAGKREYDRAISDIDEAARLNPRLPAVRGLASIVRGVVYNGKNDYDRAIVELDQGIRLVPKMAIAYLARGTAYNGKGDYDRAIADVNEAIRLNPKDAPAYSERGWAYSGKGEYDRAIAELDQAIRLNPKNAIAHFRRGSVHTRNGDYERAIADFDEALRLDPAYAAARNDRARAQADLAALPSAAEDVGTCRNGAGDDAIAACTRMLKRSPNDASVYDSRGAAYSGKGAYDLAIADFDKAIKIDPKDAAAYNNRGLAHDGKGAYERAIADFNQALRRDPDFTPARQNRERAQAALAALPADIGTCKNASGDDTIAACSRVLKRIPKDVTAHGNRALAYIRKGEYDRAAVDLDEVIRLNPRDAATWGGPGAAAIFQGLIYNFKGEYDRAIAELDQAIRLDPKNAAAIAYDIRAEAYIGKGEYDRAFVDVDQAMKIDPNAAAHRIRSEAYIGKGEYDRAVAESDEAIRLDRKNVFGYSGRGLAYNNKGEYDRAIADFDEAIRLGPDTANAYCHRGFAYGQKGDFDRAMADLNKGIALNPRFARGYIERAAVYELRGDHDRAVADFQAALKLAPGLSAAADVMKLQAALAWKPPEAGAAQPPRDPVVVAPPSRRVALVIGNSRYAAAPLLPNPKRDAEAVAAALRQAGFQVVELAVDLDRDGMVKALRRFRGEVDKADWALVYFAGHGIEINRVNYLIPVDATLADDRDVKDESISYETVLNAVRDAKALRLVVLDACRVNPFKERMHRSISLRGGTDRGLAPPPETEPGTLVVYSAKEGDVAEDGDTGNSPFARAFVAQLRAPGVEVRRVFDNVRDDVIEATHGRQQPFTYGSLPGRKDFYFRAAK
jgi:tetratricopeptide (TPR) repeat protein